jgi:hypothetical protein
MAETGRLLHGAVISGGINAVINGIIHWFQVKGQPLISITADSISTKEHTVMGSAIILAFTLSAIIACISWFTFKGSAKPKFFPGGVLLILKNAFLLFGLFVTLAILWQRIVGTVEVTPLTAAVVVGMIAGLVAGLTDYLTKKELVKSVH